MQRWMHSAAGGTSQRLNPGDATVRLLSSVSAKGMRMAGQHGNARTTTLNLEVVEGDAERGLLLVRGSIPGPNGALVFVRNAVKGGPVAAPVFGGIVADDATDAPDEVVVDATTDETESGEA